MDLPLASLRVLDLTEGDAQYCGRYLADLGAQADVAVMHLGPVLAALGAGHAGSPGSTAWVLPCAGDDEWCVIDVRDEEDLTRLAALVEGADLARWTIGDPPLRPAPVPGEHTRQIGQTLLGLSPDDIDHLIREGILEDASPTVPDRPLTRGSAP
jgi:crotonobetainyl-CoA:carnitine CoA-transferase CaiB-like acyl-CoA transferase